MRALTQRLASGLHFSQPLLMTVWRIGQRGIIKLKAEARGQGRGAVMTVVYMRDATGLNPEYGREYSEIRIRACVVLIN